MNDLKVRLEQHAMWLLDKNKGCRFVVKSGECLQSANFRYADLRSADLQYADLQSANFRYANLQSANLQSADLQSANFRYANLQYADLQSANFRYANLQSANLQSANLQSADLQSADLQSANFRYANLQYADLQSADLQSANLQSANLQSANLQHIKDEFLSKLLFVKSEAKGLYDFLQKGKINGTAYEGECACFVGTISNLRKENYKNLSCDLKADADSLTERWFLGISENDTPANNQISKITCHWIEEICKENNILLPRYKILSSDEAPECF